MKTKSKTILLILFLEFSLNIEAQNNYFSLNYEKGIQRYKQFSSNSLSSSYGITYFFSDKNSVSFFVEMMNYAKKEKLHNLDIVTAQYFQNYTLAKSFYFAKFLKRFQPFTKIGVGLLRQQQLKIIQFSAVNNYATRNLFFPNASINLGIAVPILKFIQMKFKYRYTYSFYESSPDFQSINIEFEFKLFRNFNDLKYEK